MTNSPTKKPKARKSIKPHEVPSEDGWVIVIDNRITSGFIRTKELAVGGNKLRAILSKPTGTVMRAELKVTP